MARFIQKILDFHLCRKWTIDHVARRLTLSLYMCTHLKLQPCLCTVSPSVDTHCKVVSCSLLDVFYSASVFFIGGEVQQIQSCLTDQTLCSTMQASHKLIQLLFSVLVLRKCFFLGWQTRVPAPAHLPKCLFWAVHSHWLYYFATEGTRPLTVEG